jgi:hypothetical protein
MILSPFVADLSMVPMLPGFPRPAHAVAPALGSRPSVARSFAPAASIILSSFVRLGRLLPYF